MPVDTELERSPNGVPYLRAVSRGEVSASEAHHLMEPMRALLAVVPPGSDFSREARSVLAGRGAQLLPVALVMESPGARVMMNFAFKMVGASARSRVFAKEAEATQWLFSTLDI